MARPTSRRVRAAAETPVSAHRELTQLQYVVAAGLSAYGMPPREVIRSAIGCIRGAVEAADEAGTLRDPGDLSPSADLRRAIVCYASELWSRLVLKWR
jgi:hypothetical protein